MPQKLSHLRSLPCGKVYAGAHRVADGPERPRGAGGCARARPPARGGSRRVCAGAGSSPRSGARLLHTSEHTHLTGTPASPSLARDPASAGPASLSSLSFGRSSSPPSSQPACPPQPVRSSAGARPPIHLRTTARRARESARGRASLIFHLPEPRALPARGGAMATLPITSAPGSARPLPPAPLPPAKLLP